MTYKMKAIALAAGFTCVLAPAHAATISYEFFNDAGSVSEQGPTSVTGTTFTQENVTTDVGVAAAVKADVDLVAGTVKFATSAQTTAQPFGTKRKGGIAMLDLEVAERFTVSGSGSVTFSAAIDGVLTSTLITSSNVGVQAQAGATLIATKVDPSGALVDEVVGFQRFSDTILPDAFTGLFPGDEVSKQIDELISISFDVVQGDVFDFSFATDSIASTFSSTFNTFSQADFLNTANLSFVASPGVTLAASDPNFLAGTGTGTGTGGGGGGGQPPAIPVPASLPLLLAGLGALLGLKRRTA